MSTSREMTSDSKLLTAWNPLEFCTSLEFDDLLCLDEIEEFGNATREILEREGLPEGKTDAPVIGSEVGDDREDFSRSAEKIAAAHMAQGSIVGMVTSKEDTTINRLTGNYTEVTCTVPTDPSTGYHYARKSGDFTQLGYNDSIILRIILDVSKGDEHHSSTPPGKMSMLGNRLSTPRKENRGIWQIASLFQDAYLSTHTASEPKYLPQAMGGSGVTALFDNPENIFLYVHAYKGGGYARIYGTAVAELEGCISFLERGIQTAPVLANRLREKQEYFWGTYAEKVFVPKLNDLLTRDVDKPPLPIYEATGGSNRYQAFENRLVRTKHLIGRRAAEREWATTRRLSNLVMGIYDSTAEMTRYETDIRRRIKSKYDNALNANSALKNLLERNAQKRDVEAMMGNKSFRMITTGRRTFTKSDAVWVYHNGRNEFFSLNEVSTSEDMFIRTEISVEESFKVGGILLRPIIGRSGTKPVTTTTRVGLYEINSTMEDWAENMLNRLTELAEKKSRPLSLLDVEMTFNEDPEWVNDDTGLIAQCISDHKDAGLRSYSVILVSNDNRLGNQMSNSANVVILRVSPYDYIRWAYQNGIVINSTCGVNDGFLEHLSLGKHRPDRIYIDTGSVSASASNMTMDESSPSGMVKRTLMHTGWNNQGHRESTVKLQPVPQIVRSKAVRVHLPTQRPKIWRNQSRPYETTYGGSESNSWRNSDRTPSHNTWA